MTMQCILSHSLVVSTHTLSLFLIFLTLTHEFAQIRVIGRIWPNVMSANESGNRGTAKKKWKERKKSIPCENEY